MQSDPRPEHLRRIFIADQTIRRLAVPIGDEHRVMAYVTALGLDPKRQVASLIDEELEKLWPQVDRLRFLSDLSIRRLCVTVDAGVGKSLAVRQLQEVTHQFHPHHLAVTTDLKDLPPNRDGMVDDDYEIYGRKYQPLLSNLVTSKLQNAQVKYQTAFTKRDAEFIPNLVRMLARRGDLTLIVDGVDQSSLTAAENQAKVLASFLEIYPKVRLVIAGRPYSIQRIASSMGFGELTQESNGNWRPKWTFCKVELFTPEQVYFDYLGPNLAAAIERLEADQQFLPRTLNIVKGLSNDELRELYTAADLYWYSIYKSLNESLKPVAESELKRWSYDRLMPIISAVAFAMWSWQATPVMHVPSGSTGNSTAGHSQSTVDDTVDGLMNWMYELGLAGRLRQLDQSYFERNDLRDALVALGKINLESIKLFPYYENEGSLASIQFADATIRDFLAAYWCARYMDTNRSTMNSVCETQLLSARTSKVLSYPTESSFGQDYHEFWKLLVDMPVRLNLVGLPQQISQEACWTQSVAALFEQNDKPRPTELMYRAWPGLLARSTEKLVESRTYDEQAIAAGTTKIQQIVRLKFVQQFVRPCTFRTADQVLYKFLSEYLELQASGDTEIDLLEKSFTQDFTLAKVHPIPAGKFLYEDERERNETVLKEIETPYVMSCYQVWNNLYGKFDDHHKELFPRYKLYSPYPRGASIYKTWFDAWAMATWAHSRLPTELEWEAACRGRVGDLDPARHTQFWFGNDELENPRQLQNYAWFHDNSDEVEGGVNRRRHAHAHTVGTKLAEPNYGLYDMHGNVWEWTASGDSKYNRRFSRGGSYKDKAKSTRCLEWATFGDPTLVNSILGFRLSRTFSRSKVRRRKSSRLDA